MREVIASIVNAGKQSPETTKAIEGVMLHIRAREMVTQKRRHIVASVLLSALMGQIIGLMSLILYPLTDTLRFLAAIVFFTIGYVIADRSMDISQLLILVLLMISVSLADLRRSIDWFRKIFFDLIDIVTCATITKLFSYFLIHGRQEACESAIESGGECLTLTPIAYHFFTSRQPFIKNDELTLMMNEMLSFSQEPLPDEEVLRVVGGYWNSEL